jgi:hypothetical protein
LTNQERVLEYTLEEILNHGAISTQAAD